MKCYEVRKCSKEEREACYVWNSFRDNPQDIENVKCWVLKGAYQEESGQQLKKCKQCPYFAAMNRDAGIASEGDADVAVITCEGAVNTERTKALEKVWETLRQQNRVKILLDMSRVSNIYSCGLGAIIKIHKEASAAKGLLVVVVNDEYIINLFTVTKLSRLLHIVKNNRDARDVFDALKKRELEAQKKAMETTAAAAAKAGADAKAAAEAAKPSKPKERPACWVYWKGHNPNNATKCDECFTKIKPTGQPCWIVDGMIEGISFQYVDQDCEACRYFQEFAGAEEL